MSVSTSCAIAHPKPSVSASIILPQRERKHYQRWQRLCTTLGPAQQGFVPSALEYENFQQWLKRQDSGYFSDHFDDLAEHVKTLLPDSTVSQVDPPVAAVCQHKMHPVAVGQRWLRCPVCTIDMHIKYLRVLKRALESAGGRAPTCTLMSSEFQDDVYSAWLYGKICALQELSRLERIAEQEADWSERNSRAQNKDLQTAQKALELYWSEIGGCDAKKSCQHPNKTVTFGQETRFDLGRPSAYFWQKSPRYETGKYTLSEQDHEDNNGTSEDTEVHDRPTRSQTDDAKGHDSTNQATDATDTLYEDEAQSFPDEDDSDSDWEDVESDEDEDISYIEDSDMDDGSILFETEEQTDFIVFEDA
ncbi:hypothetical protein T440DRAFT_43032 [Plenodomus tracheiphilus IPT5]|uniref:Uncharacterized protein n=1 Tax=Plenodomus tracheiphilus IPT5 TaxID=1408161 RepID=A0A6A7BAN0_9PLEO|nr:hypothetical protein T440DRAFT_43032 [Plenodomus tracheiphilus IPT5]